MKFKTGISFFLIAISFVLGVFLLLVGITDALDVQRETKNYQKAIGYPVYFADEDGTTYRLTYSYTVDGREYSVFTNYTAESVPEDNSTRTVRYNPKHPEEAVVSGGSSYGLMILIGTLFTFVPLIFLLGILYSFGCLQNFFDHFIDIGLGLLFLVLGFGLIYFIRGTISPMEIFKSFSLTLVIPLLFVAVGIFEMIKFVSHLTVKKDKQGQKAKSEK